ncbi:MAG: electron transport complex subunit RsxE [Cellulosilyticaceae bacterium]
MKIFSERLKTGIISDNPIYMQVLGMCPTLAVTTSVENAVGMGLTTTAVLVCSNIAISMLKKWIPAKIRIPAFIVIIASFVTMMDLLLQAYIPSLHSQLGLFIPLIVVNCLILARAEAYASKNKILPSMFDGIGMGLGFTVGLASIGVVRELLGVGTILGFQVLPTQYDPAIIMILAPGAFFTLGILMALLNLAKAKKQ